MLTQRVSTEFAKTRRTLGLLIALLVYPTGAQAQPFDLSWNTIDGGGAMFITGGTYSLDGTIAQPDSSSFSTPMTGGDFELVGGFWPVAEPSQPPPCPGDLNGSGAVDLSDLATLLSHFGMIGGATAADGDIDGDGDVDLTDLATLLSNFGLTCP